MRCTCVLARSMRVTPSLCLHAWSAPPAAAPWQPPGLGWSAALPHCRAVHSAAVSRCRAPASLLPRRPGQHHRQLRRGGPLGRRSDRRSGRLLLHLLQLAAEEGAPCARNCFLQRAAVCLHLLRAVPRRLRVVSFESTHRGGLPACKPLRELGAEMGKTLVLLLCMLCKGCTLCSPCMLCKGWQLSGAAEVCVKACQGEGLSRGAAVLACSDTFAQGPCDHGGGGGPTYKSSRPLFSATNFSLFLLCRRGLTTRWT